TKTKNSRHLRDTATETRRCPGFRRYDATMDRRNPYQPLSPHSLPEEGDRPLEICLVRGSAVESRHRVHVLACNGAGEVVHRWAHPGLAFQPRSAIKLLQAATWVSRGLEKYWKLGPEELALACASHYAEDYHVRTAEAWLKKLGFGEETLECGSHLPYSTESA